jgi:hypothetical protein
MIFVAALAHLGRQISLAPSAGSHSQGVFGLVSEIDL